MGDGQKVVALPGVEAEIKAARQQAIGVIAKADSGAVAAAFEAMGDAPGFTRLRAPESGLVMVRGKMGGAGAAFNVGEMTVTRAAVRLESGEVGVGYVSGRNKRHAELCALADAMVQSRAWREPVERLVIAPLRAAQDAARVARSRKAAATAVEFFTLVRTRAHK